MYQDEYFTFANAQEQINIFENAMEYGLNIILNNVLQNETLNEYRLILWDIINFMEDTVYRIKPIYFDFSGYLNVKLTEINGVAIESKSKVIKDGWHYNCDNITNIDKSIDCVTGQGMILVLDINKQFKDILNMIMIDRMKEYKIYIQDIIHNEYNHSHVDIFEIELLSQNWSSSSGNIDINDNMDKDHAKNKKNKAIIMPSWTRWIVYSFIAFCVLLALIGSIHAMCIGADNIRISGCIYFAVYTFDFYSDIIFSLEILNAILIYDGSINELNFKFKLILFILSWLFIIIPWIVNMRQLITNEAKWCLDPIIGDKIRSWLIDWSIFLNVIAATCGSAFGAVEFCNSNLFSYDPLSMGLTERHIKRFNLGRLISNILLENVPQIAIQIIWGFFFSETGWKSNILWIAIFASLASIIVMIADICASNKILNINKDGVIQEILCIKMQIKSKEIEKYSKRLQITTFKLRDGISELLTIPPRCIEIAFPIRTKGGLEISFTIRTNKVTISDLMTIIDDALISDSKDFHHIFKEKWKLKQLPKIENVSKNIRDNDEFEIIQQNESRLRARSSILAAFLKMKNNKSKDSNDHDMIQLKQPKELQELNHTGTYNMDQLIIEEDKEEEEEQKMVEPLPIIDYGHVHHQLSIFSQSSPNLYNIHHQKNFSDMSYPTVPSSKHSVIQRSNSVDDHNHNYNHNHNHIQFQNNNNDNIHNGHNNNHELNGNNNNNRNLFAGIKDIQFKRKVTKGDNNETKGNEEPTFIMRSDSDKTMITTEDSYAEQLKLNEEIKYKEAQLFNKRTMEQDKKEQEENNSSKPSKPENINTMPGTGFRRINSIKRSPKPTKVPPSLPMKKLASNLPSIV